MKEEKKDLTIITLIMDDNSQIKIEFETDFYENVFELLESSMKSKKMFRENGEFEMTIELEDGYVVDGINSNKIIAYRN